MNWCGILTLVYTGNSKYRNAWVLLISKSMTFIHNWRWLIPPVFAGGFRTMILIFIITRANLCWNPKPVVEFQLGSHLSLNSPYFFQFSAFAGYVALYGRAWKIQRCNLYWCLFFEQRFLVRLFSIWQTLKIEGTSAPVMHRHDRVTFVQFLREEKCN